MTQSPATATPPPLASLHEMTGEAGSRTMHTRPAIHTGSYRYTAAYQYRISSSNVDVGEAMESPTTKDDSSLTDMVPSLLTSSELKSLSTVDNWRREQQHRVEEGENVAEFQACTISLATA